MKSGERERKRDEAQFARKEPCIDCAFGPDSPERQDPETWDALKRQTDPANGIVPFRCHFTHDGQEMPTDADGNYVPKLDEHGSPIGWPICAGWAKTFDVNLERLRRKL
ncbi:MAG: hypothetical protein AAF721_00345 [Myxococcota bacterium]